LMVKFDHAINLPQIFKNNDLAILPITRGDYVISTFDLYHKLENENSKITKFSLPDNLQSLDPNKITSETMALNCALASGIISDFMGEGENNIFATVSGRMSSGKFTFNIKDIKSNSLRHINVNNSQIEIDAAYEGISSLALVEAKMDLSDDFLVRQLYYPFRTWQPRIRKKVKSIFLIYTNGIFKLFEYAFDDFNNYSSLRLIQQKNYSIEDTVISLSDIEEVLYNTAIIEEPKGIPFPQADKFERVINLCELVTAQSLTSTDVTDTYDFNIRQTNYYTDAARYLGLLEKNKDGRKPVYSISQQGRQILNLGFKQRQLSFCKKILSHNAFNNSLRLYLKKSVCPSNDEIIEIMRQSGLDNIAHSTFKRRASSIRGWLNWIISLINDN
ncbi:MAG: hypothetical protein IJR94_02610, partial [Synergistaceae bacterium]|nr:hypothetical protein [Synergistaceae bacterium]